MDEATSALSLRVYVEVDDHPAALEEAKALVGLVQPHARVTGCAVEPDAKTPEYFGVRIALASTDPVRSFAGVTGALAAKWTHGGTPYDSWAVWSEEMDGASALRSARWAHLELYAERGAAG
jgi:hypothetical protein